jgi:hypothetical protein
MTKLVSIVKSEKEDKKYKAIFKLDNNKIKEVHFGRLEHQIIQYIKI